MAFRNLLLILFLSCSVQFANSQQFEYHSSTPFGIEIINEAQDRIGYKLLFTDRDKDGDQDLFLVTFGLGNGGGFDLSNIIFFLEYQENIGTKTSPEFGPRVPAYDSIYIPNYLFLPDCGDLNGDGLPDFIAMADIELYSEIQHLVIYLSNGETFDIKNDSDFGLEPFEPGSSFFPVLADLDNDGDQDILLSGTTTKFGDTTQIFTSLYAKNIGTTLQPNFLGWFNNPYGIMKDTIGEIIQVFDIDVDGDMDAVSLAFRDSVFVPSVKKNIAGRNQRPEFSELKIAPYGMPVPEGNQQFIDFTLTDLDGDGDLDFFLIDGGTGFELLYYENIQCIAQREEIYIDMCEGEVYEGYTMTGVYIDTFLAMNACDSIRTLHLTVHADYEDNLNLMKCEGDTIFLGDQEITSNGNYIIHTTSSNGCDSIINVNATFFMIDASVSIDENILSVMDIYHSYQWMDCNSGEVIPGETNATFTPSTSGSYAVKITTATGCSKISECVDVVISSTEIQKVSNKIFLYPNPGQGKIQIRNESTRDIQKIKVVNVKGQTLLETPVNSTSSFDISHLNPGVYLILIQIDDLTIPKKIIKL